MEILGKNKKEIIEIFFKSTVWEKKKNAFDGLISQLGMAEEGISELEHMTIETSKTKTQNDRTEYPRTVELLQCM